MTEQAPRRRLAAILAADVVGYARLMGIDESGTLRRLASLRAEILDPLIAKHQGRIVKLMGDGLLVEFASVVDAVSCAEFWQLTVAQNQADQTSDARLSFRIGVHLGDIIAESDDIFGNGVNIAARLEGLADPGGICISDDAFRQVRGKVEVKFEDLGERKLKNIAEPLKVYRAVRAETTSTAPTLPEATLPLPSRPSVAVLPFVNLSGNPDQEFLADGITEDITTELSKFHTLFVIARNSAYAFKGQPHEAKQIGARLGVRYVVEGSVRRRGNRVRITAQLIDATEDKHIWAQRYDRDVEDIFAVQDEVTLSIVTAMEPLLALSERNRALRKPPENLDAWESYQCGLWHMYQYNPEDREKTLAFFRRATERDRNFAPAYAGIAYTIYSCMILGASQDRIADLQAAFDAGQKAVNLDEHDPFGWATLARIHILRAEHNAAIAASDTAITLNPNFALGHFGRAHALWHAGRPAEAVASHDEALRLCPLDPLMWAYLASKAIALVMLGRFEEAVGVSLKSQQQPRSRIFSHLAEISALGKLQRGTEAQAAIARALLKKPDLTIAYVAEALPITDPRCREIFHDGLRKAGLSE